ncbi:MAG: right-handed parallel beta-helix repeat-containing protein, partial [Verrucomicrobiota bacterium]
MKTKFIFSFAIIFQAFLAAGANYYVNDASTNGDIYCTAPGAVTNSGASASAPALSLGGVLATNTLSPGDMVFIDSGNYTNSTTPVVGPADSGSQVGGMVVIKGAGIGKTILYGVDGYGIHCLNAGYVRLDSLCFRGGVQGVRVEGSQHVELLNCDVGNAGNGVVISGGSDNRIENCLIHDDGDRGVVASSSSTLVITGSRIYNHISASGSRHGIDLSYSCNAAQITANTITNNIGQGIRIYSCATPTLQDNLVAYNGQEGVYLQSCSSASVVNHTIYKNVGGVHGYYSPSLTLTGNRIFSNSSYGVYAESGAINAAGNLIYANTGTGLTLLSSPSSLVENNTFYRNTTVNLRLAGTHSSVRVANNIISSSGPAQTCIQFDTIGTSWLADYNDYFTTNGAVLWNWKGPRYSLAALQNYSGMERHSIDRDPQFVDADGADNVLGGAGWTDDNFHLAATSPALDAGDPASSFAAEPAPNGSRINLGNFGGTAQADTSGSQRVLRLLAPNGGEIAFRRLWVRWAATGPWATNDMVKIEYSANGGGSWITAANAAALNSANGFYGWDITGITPGTNYLVRASCVDQTNITESSYAVFEIQGPGAKTIYVNDGSTANDTWCTAPGAVTNTGLSVSSPLDSFQSVIEKYPAIGAGDEIRFDTGVFDAGRTVYLNQQNNGSSGSPLVIRGSTSGAAVFDRLDQSDDTLWFDGMSYVRFEGLNFTRGATGLRLVGTGLNPSVGITITDCQSYGNSSYGMLVGGCTTLLVKNCTGVRNGSDGFSLSANDATVTNNFAGWNNGSGLGFGGYGVISYNQCASNNNNGIGASRNDQVTLLVSSNQLHHNGQSGLWINGGYWGGDAQAIGNSCYANTGAGMVGNRCYGLIGNLVYSNSGDGIISEYASHLTKNLISDNRGHGITGWIGIIATNNLLVRNGGGSGWNIVMSRDSLCRNNTLVGSNGVYAADTGCTIVNNIISARGAGMTAIYAANPSGTITSDYNDIYVTDGAIAGNWFGPRATLSSWQQVSLRDPHSISVEPRFVDGATNFHLRSTAGSYRGAAFTAPAGGSFVADADLSFCIDGGDPSAGYSQEPSPNGGRLDLGAFGNSPDASLTPDARFSLLVDPLPGTKWFGTRTITWLTRGPWVGGDLVNLDFSADGGVSWTNIVASVDFALGRYDWNTAGLPPGTNYLVRISKTDGSAADVADAAFEVSASGPRTYYVNDNNTLNDEFCSAPGSAANDGLSAATPKDSIQAILDTYNVVGGDTIKVDAGSYLLGATIVMTRNDAGSPGNPIVIQGSTNGTTINRQNTGYDAFYLQGAEYVQFRNLKFTGGRFGLSGDGTSANYLRGVEIYNCETMTNGSHGFNFSYSSNLVISACSLHHNGSRGASLGAAVQVTIVSNVFAFNSSGQGLYVDSSGVVMGNLCFSNSGEGLTLGGNFLVTGNTCWGNYSVGIHGWSGVTVTNNLCFSNRTEGISIYGGNNYVAGNRVFGNRGTGIYFENSGRVQRNVVYSNGGHGIQFEGFSGDYREIINNLCYLNGSGPGYFNIIGGANIWQGKRGLIENNTCYGWSGIYIGDATALTNRNNIIWAIGSNSVALVRYADSGYLSGIVESDNNLIYTTGGAIVGQWNGNQVTLSDWQYATKQDNHSFIANPQFVNPAGADGIIGGDNGADDNFHLASTAGSYAGAPFTATDGSTFTTNDTTSPAIDAATTASLVGDEIAPNGDRRNLGAFGGTFDASLSPGTLGISILNLAANDTLRGVKTLYWITSGPWAGGETIRLEYSSNGGADWTTAAGLNAVLFNQASLDWDTSSLTPGTNYVVRLVGNSNSAVCAVSPVAIIANGPTDFYVNDANPTNDVYCTAVGDDSNSGLAPSAPKATLKRLFSAYKLIGGDRVWIDTGYWKLDSTLQFFDSGTVAAKIRFIGSTNAAGSQFDRGDTAQIAFLVNLVDNVSFESLKIVNSQDGIHIEGSGSDLCDGVQVLGCELSANFRYPVYFTSATNLLIANCDIHDNSSYSIYGGGYGVIRNNRVSRTDYYEAIRVWGGPLLVEGNQVFNNDSTGIAGTTLVTVRGNTVFSNAGDGISLDNADAAGNRVFLNKGNGIFFEHSGRVQRNVVYSNSGHGIQAGYSSDYRELVNNLCYLNGDAADEYNIYLPASFWNPQSALIENNTVYGGGGIYIGDPSAVTNRNNIIWATGAGRYALRRYSNMNRFPNGYMESDYNNIIATDGATFSAWLGDQKDLLEWHKATGYDTHSFSADPLFVNPAGADGVLGGTNGLDDNFHLASTAGSFKGLPFTALTTAGFTADASHSPCIDAGLPASATGAELAPNSERIDLGAFGGTADASLSTATLGVELGLVGNNSVLRGTVPVYWWTHGPWQSNDTVLLEYSSNGGGSWSTITGAGALPFAQSVFAWDTSGLAPGSNYKVRATPNAGGTPSVSGLLRVLSNTGTTFYVNDGSTTNDIYCSAVGSDANDGLTPATPMGTVKRLIATYRLMAGDTVFIDTGLWTLDGNLVFTDSGAPGQLIRLVGSTNVLGSVFNRNDISEGMYGFHLSGNSFMRLENLKITGAQHGITGGGSQGIELAGCEAYGNNVWGIVFGSCSNIVVSGCIARNNGHGLDVDGGSGTVTGNSVHHNNGWGLYLNGSFLAEGNDCYNNSSSALYGQNGVRACNNQIHENPGEYALRLSGTTSEAVSNNVYLNGSHGVLVTAGAAFRRNVVYSNGRYGLWVTGNGNMIQNNLVYDNDRNNEGYWNIGIANNANVVENNTLYGGNGYYCWGPWGSVARNNIIWARGAGHYAIYQDRTDGTPVSDYNNLYASDGATLGYWAGARTNLAAWKSAAGMDANSLSTDPLFVDVNGADDTLGGFYGADDDFHLSSIAGSYHDGFWFADATNSPCIDAGDPSTTFTNEPYYNGLRINQGAYGNTAEASMTAYAGAFCALNLATNPAAGGMISVWPPGVSNLYYPANTFVTLTASNNLGFIWGNWSGAVSSTSNTMSLVVSSNTAVSANFIPVMPHVLYRFEDNYHSSIDNPPDLTNINSGQNFTTMTVRGVARRVLSFPAGGGLQLQPTLGVFPSELYTIAMLFKFDAVNSYRRILDFRNGIEQGLYVQDGRLHFWNYGAAPAVTMTNGTWHMVAITRDVSGQMKLYCDGVLVQTLSDTGNFGVVSSASALRFFKDNTSEDSGGAVSRIHIFSRVLDQSEIAALNALDDASPLITSPALTGAAQGVPFVWPVTGPGVATNLASGLPPGLSMDPATALISGTPNTPGVFDALLTSTNGFGVATQTLRIVVSSSTNLLFREDFNNGFSANWNGSSTDTNYYTFQPGMMDLRANNGNPYGSANVALNLFACSNSYAGDMMITMGVTRYEPTTANYNRLCLTAWDDYDNNVSYAYGYSDARRLIYTAEQGQANAGDSILQNFGSQPFLLRLVKQGGGASDRYTAYYSTNGVDFAAFANNTAVNGDGSPNKFGFWMGLDPSQNNHALIDYFEVAALPLTTNMQTYTDDFTVGNGAASWRIQNSANLYPVYTVDQSQGALAMSKPAGGTGGSGEWPSATSAVTATGDFDVRVDYRDLVMTRTGGGYGNEVQLIVNYGTKAFVIVRADEPSFGGGNVRVWDSDSGSVGAVATTATSGTLRVVRTGTVMKGYHNNTFLWQRTCTTNPATFVVNIQNNGTADPISVKFDNFYVSAQQVTLAPPVFTSAALTSGMLNSPFVWQVAADYWSGLSAAGLPPGLSMNTNGLISGTPTVAGAFNATITATNAQASTTQTLRMVISDNANVLWREDFNNGLASAWTTVPIDTNYYKFQPGQMNLRANNGDTWTYYNRTLNLFAVNTPTAGDFMITLGISRFTPTLRDSPGIYLVAWDDTDNSVRYGYNGGYSGRNTAMSIESRGGMTSSTGIYLDYGTNAFAMRLVKQGNMYSVWASTNGTDFTAITNIPTAAYGNGLPRQVGFWMGLDPNQTETMLIDYFEVSSLTLTNAGTPPVFASANLTGGLQDSPFRWDVSAAYATGFSATGLPPGLSLAPQNGRITGAPTMAGVYDSTITATNAFGVASQTLRIVVRNTVGLVFREDFTSGLSSNWTTVPTDTNYFNYLPGQAWLRADYGEAWSSINRPLHLYAVDVPTNGDFTVTLAVSKFAPSRYDSPQVGVIAWKDTDNFVRSIYYGRSSGAVTEGQMVIEQSGSPTPTQFPLVFGDGPFLLRLQRASGVYTSSWSTNGVDFTVNPASAFSATFAPTKWGFYLGGDPTYLSVALVDFFELASGVPPAITSQGWLTGAQLGAPFAWQITNSAGSTLIASNLPPGLALNTNGLITGVPSQLGAFDTLLLASNNFGVATRTLRIVVGGGDGTIFRDDFSGSYVSGWNPLPSDTNYYHFASSNQLWLRANNGDTWTYNNRAINLFSINTPGTNDWIATLAVNRYEPTGVAYNMLNLVAWTDYENYIRLTYAFDRSPSITAENSGGITASVGRACDFGAQPFLLRLVKQGNLYTSFLSTNGVDFVPIVTNAVPLNGTPAQIGFWLGNDPSYANTAMIDYFEVVASGPPVVTSQAQALGVLNQPFTWQLASLGSARFSAAGLPAGLSLNGTNGIISGTPSQAGNFNVGITASNHLGLATQALNLIVLWPQPTNNLPANLISWWRGETNAQDQMGAHHGTLGGGTSFTNGWSGQGFALNGANSSVGLGTWFNLQQFTLSLWVKPEATQPTWADILDNNHTGSRSWVIQSQNTAGGGKSRWSCGAADGGGNFVDLTIGAWQHLVWTRDSNYVSRLYLNGMLVATNTGTGPIPYDGTQSLFLGSHASLGRYFNGQIDELMCFDRTLDSNEVAYLAGTVNPFLPPVITSATNASGQAGLAFNYQITAVNAPGGYAAIGLPNGLSVNTTNGLISGIPIEIGVFNVQLAATNAYGISSVVLDLNITPVPPVITSALSASGWVGQSFNYQIIADNSPTLFGVTGLPDGLTVNTNTGAISGTPAASGGFSAQIMAANAGGSNTAALSITILPAVPVITSANYATGQVGQSFSYQIAVSNSATLYGATGLPDGLTVNTNTGAISGIPVAAGSYPVQIMAASAGGTNTAGVSIAILPAAPVITSANYATGRVEQVFSYQIAASNSPTIYGATGLPGGLTVNTNTGAISGTPAASGSYSAQIMAANAGGSNTAALSITILPAVPVITSANSATGQVNVSFSYTITANGSPTNFGAAGLPGGLTLNPTNGLISG